MFTENNQLKEYVFSNSPPQSILERIFQPTGKIKQTHDNTNNT